MDLAQRVARRFLARDGQYFQLNDVVLYGKYKNHRGKIVGFGQDKWGNPTVEVEPVPKGRKQNKVFGLFKIWRADVKEKALAEQAKANGELTARVLSRFALMTANVAGAIQRPSQAQIDYAKRLLKQVGSEEPDWTKMDAVEVSNLIDDLKKKRGKPIWYGNGQFSHWEK